MKYIKGLDVLRAVAVFFVIITHWGPHTFKSEILTFIFQKIIPDGNFGVDLFFVLSGYLITRILLKAREEQSEEYRFRTIRAFYIRRALRIFPIYYLLIFVVCLLGAQNVISNLDYYLTYTSNFLVFKTNSWDSITHTWSLAVEEQFYLIWPWFIIFLPRKHLLTFILTALIFGILSTLTFDYFLGDFFYILLPPCITAFSIGALLAYSEFYPASRKVIVPAFKLLFPIIVLFFFINQFGYKLSLIRAVNSIIAINLIMYVVNENYNKFTKMIFTNKLLINTGKISYGIYLYHFIVPSYWNQFVDYLNRYFLFTPETLKFLKYPPPAYLIELALVFIISYSSYYYLELRFIRLKNRFGYVTADHKNLSKECVT